jgi:TolB-like protein/class 3 adenylate cyclase/Tfp pilus assembly protein PilF
VASEHVERKLAAILAADVAGYSRLAGADEERTLARLRALRGDLIDPAITAHHGRVVKRTGDGLLVEFRSVVDAMRCAIEVQNGMVERNAGLPSERRIEFRVGIHLGDVIEEIDGDLMGDGVNIAARIEAICEPGGICLSRAAHEQVEGKIAQSFIDLGDRDLKNIARPVRVFAVDMRGSANAAAPLIASSAAPRLSIVVLPFANIGRDPEQDYFIDGVTESLTIDLSRMAGSFVIGRNTAFTYKGKAMDLKQIGLDLNVRYVLEGSVQRGGNRLRVNVQLIDAETGKHLWAERFDKPVGDLFDMQDEIVARLARQLDTELVIVEARRAEISPHPDSTDLYFQGRAWASRGATSEYMAQARGFYERALGLDPRNIDAIVGMATVDITMAVNLLTDDRVGRLAAAEAALSKALSLAPDHARAHLLLGMVQIGTKRAAQGMAECERALALDRNLAGAHAQIGLAKLYIGHGEEAEAHVREAIRLSPRDTSAHIWALIAGVAKLHVDADEEAVAWFRRANETNRNAPIAHFCLAAAAARLGRMEEAQAAVQTGLALDPAFTLRRYSAGAAASDHPAFVAQRERIYDAMRRAGVPEG